MSRSLRRSISVAAALLLALAAAGCASAPAPSAGSGTGSGDEGSAKNWQQASEQIVEQTLADEGIPGAAISATRDGEEWEFVTGEADTESKTPVELSAPFAYRSITKSFTGTAILMFVDKGSIGLDEPVAKYVEGVPSGDVITIRMLLGMRSGLPEYTKSESFQQLLGEDPTRSWSDSEILELAFQQPMAFEPGTEYKYTNTNTVVLGQVLESVRGRSWSTVVDEMLLGPLKLDSVDYPDNRAKPEGTAVPYHVHENDELETLPDVRASLFSAAGGLFGTVGDLRTWAAALGSAELLLQGKTADERFADPSPTDGDPTSPLYDKYGLGMGEFHGWIGHTGVGLGYQALAMYHPETGDSIAIVMNGAGADPDVPAKLFEKLLAEWDEK